MKDFDSVTLLLLVMSSFFFGRVHSHENSIRAAAGAPISRTLGAGGCCLMSQCTDDCSCCNSYWTPMDEKTAPTRGTGIDEVGGFVPGFKDIQRGGLVAVFEGRANPTREEDLKCCVLYCVETCKCCDIDDILAQSLAEKMERDPSIASVLVVDPKPKDEQGKELVLVRPDMSAGCCQFSCPRWCDCCTAAALTTTSIPAGAHDFEFMLMISD